MTVSRDAHAPVTTVVHLVRHGEVDNPTGVLYGRLEGFPLSPLGLRMADLVARHLEPNDVTAVISSPLQRAQQTAAPIARLHGLTVDTDERVIESVSAFEGRSVGLDDLLHPRNWHHFTNPTKPSWGEPYTEIAARMAIAIDDTRRGVQGHEAVIVSHQLPVWTARRSLQGKRLWHNPRRRECTLASLTSLTYQDDELASITYCEPAAELLPQANNSAGA